MPMIFMGSSSQSGFLWWVWQLCPTCYFSSIRLIVYREITENLHQSRFYFQQNIGEWLDGAGRIQTCSNVLGPETFVPYYAPIETAAT